MYARCYACVVYSLPGVCQALALSRDGTLVTYLLTSVISIVNMCANCIKVFFMIGKLKNILFSNCSSFQVYPAVW